MEELELATLALGSIAIVLGIIGIILAVIFYFEIKRLKKIEGAILSTTVSNEQLNEVNRELLLGLRELEDGLGEERDKNRTLLSQKKSSETRLGQISEHLIPFLEACPYDPKTMSFLGNPIDYLVFDLDEGKIIFLEVKSGNSKASKRQKTIKNIIKTGRVFYEEIRVNEKGVKIKTTALDSPPKKSKLQEK